jgi:hypothetical protein
MNNVDVNETQMCSSYFLGAGGSCTSDAGWGAETAVRFVSGGRMYVHAIRDLVRSGQV